MNTRIKRQRYTALLCFIVYFILSLAVIGDYGRTPDESTQRLRSLVAYKYINKVVFHRNVQELESTPDLKDFNHEYYGTAIQMPAVLIEDLTDFSMDSREIYRMRHLWTFVVYFAGLCCLYLALRRIWGSESWIPLITIGMLALFPRFFAFQFTDIKNMAFTGLMMIAIYFLVRSEQNRKFGSLLCFGISSAVATNSRVMGVVLPLILLGYFFITDISLAIENAKNKEDFHLRFKEGGGIAKYIIVAVSFFGVWIVINPIAWKDPLETFVKTFQGFSHYDAWKGTMVFMGRKITCEEMPWYYLFVWFGITIPMPFIVLFLLGHVFFIVELSKAEHKWQAIIGELKWMCCFLLLYWGSVLSVIVLKSRIYIGWHHMNFVYPPFCIIAGYGVALLKKSRVPLRNVSYVVIAVTFIYLTSWIAYYHPYEPSYFNIIGKPYGDQFDREEWRTSSFPALKWILTQEDGSFSVGGSTASVASLTKEQKARVTVDTKNPDYFIECYRNVIGNNADHPGYDEIKYVVVDGYKVCSVFKKSDVE